MFRTVTSNKTFALITRIDWSAKRRDYYEGGVTLQHAGGNSVPYPSTHHFARSRPSRASLVITPCESWLRASTRLVACNVLFCCISIYGPFWLFCNILLWSFWNSDHEENHHFKITKMIGNYRTKPFYKKSYSLKCWNRFIEKSPLLCFAKEKKKNKCATLLLSIDMPMLKSKTNHTPTPTPLLRFDISA